MIMDTGVEKDKGVKIVWKQKFSSNGDTNKIFGLDRC